MVAYNKLVLILLFCVVCLLTIGAAQEDRKPTIIDRLLSKDNIEVYEAQNELIAARKDLIAQLITIIKDKENLTRKKASVRAAIFLLGEMRATEAIETLVEHISYPFVYEERALIVQEIHGGMISRGLKDMGRTYPAVRALIKIGEPCISSIITKLALTENVSEEKACLGVLVGLRQRDFVIGMLKETISKETDSKKRRLQSSLDLLSRMEE